MKTLRITLVGLVALGWSAFASHASAYCRTTTVPIRADFQPAPDKCWEEGLPLFWKSRCIGYNLHVQASREEDLNYSRVSDLAARAFTRWSGASCPKASSGPSLPSVDIRDLGPVACSAVQYNPKGANQHVIVFRDDAWPHDGTGTLALTTVTFDRATGEITNADMEVNTFEFDVTVKDPVPRTGYDFQSIITHEAGHFLGLAHSGDVQSTMRARYDNGVTSMRELTVDDVKAICAVYPPDGTRPSANEQVLASATCDPTPRGGMTGECISEKGEDKGCAFAPKRETPGTAALAVFSVLACLACLGVRRRR